MKRTQEMVDTIHGLIAYSGIEQAIIGTPIFNRLHRVLQNSLVYLTYPSNKVKRFEHSVGTMHLAGQFLFRSVCNSPCDIVNRFLAEVNEELVSWNKDLKSHTYSISYINKAVLTKYGGEKILRAPWPNCRLYRENMPATLEEGQQLGYCVAFQSVRLAGLLHDVGHLPYSHVLEHALQSLYQKVKNLPPEECNEAHKYFLEVMEPYCNSADPEIAIHEQLGQQFVDKIFECITDDLPKQEVDEYYFLAAVFYFTQKILTASEAENSLFSDLHRIVAGTLDCDRMDYCCRDEYCAGTSKEPPNYGRIFSSVSIVYRLPEKRTVQGEGSETDSEQRERCCFVPSTKALREIEALLRRRWNIYVTINYHHRVHKHELLFQEVLAELGLQEMGEEKEPPDELENALPLSVSSIWQLVAQMRKATPVEYLALQLDDSWLDTLLKHKYFEQYKETYLSFAEHGNDVTWHRLDELISVKKHYHSLIKRSGGFRQFDEYVYQQLIKSDKPELLEFLGISTEDSHAAYVKKHEGYVFNRAAQAIASDKELRANLFTSLSQRAQGLIASPDNPYRIMDCILADCSFSMGIKQTDSLCIAAPGQDEKPFVHYSALYGTLTSEKNLLPSIHIYYLPQYDASHSEYCSVDQEAFLRDIGIETGNAIVEFFQQVNVPTVPPETEVRADPAAKEKPAQGDLEGSEKDTPTLEAAHVSPAKDSAPAKKT